MRVDGFVIGQELWSKRYLNYAKQKKYQVYNLFDAKIIFEEVVPHFFQNQWYIKLLSLIKREFEVIYILLPFLAPPVNLLS